MDSHQTDKRLLAFLFVAIMAATLTVQLTGVMDEGGIDFMRSAANMVLGALLLLIKPTDKTLETIKALIPGNGDQAEQPKQ